MSHIQRVHSTTSLFTQVPLCLVALCICTAKVVTALPFSSHPHPSFSPASLSSRNTSVVWTEVKDEELVSHARLAPEAHCRFSIHEGGPNGPQVVGTTLNQEIYYRIECRPHAGYCLLVSNCSVRPEAVHKQGRPPASSSSQLAARGGATDENKRSYAIIDENSCTKEPSLFESVRYEDNFTASIFNPFPIRFRGDSSSINFECSTTLTPIEGGELCPRMHCPNDSPGTNLSKLDRQRRSKVFETE